MLILHASRVRGILAKKLSTLRIPQRDLNQFGKSLLKNLQFRFTDSIEKQLRYFVAIGLLSIASFFAFWLLEDTTSKARETEEYTAADAFVKESTDNIVAVLEGAIEEHKEERDIKERYRQKFSELIENRKQTLDPLINEYYDQCLLHVDSYLGWSEGIFGGVAGYLGGFGEGRAVENFKATRTVDQW